MTSPANHAKDRVGPLWHDALANTVAQGLPQGLLLVLTPVLVAYVSLDSFGIWTFCTSVTAVLVGLDAGLSPALSRYIAVYRAREALTKERQLISLALVLSGLLGGVAWASLTVWTGAIADVVGASASHGDETKAALRGFAVIVPLTLMHTVATSYLRGRQLYVSVALTAVAGVAAFVIVLLLVGDMTNLQSFVWASVGQAGTAAFVAVCLAARSGARPAWRGLRLGEFREVAGFAGWSQLASAAAVLNLRTDAFVIAAVSSNRILGIYGVGATIATAFRNIPAYAQAPMRTILAREFGSGGLSAANVRLATMEAKWRRGLLGYSVVCTPLAVGALAVMVRPSLSLALTITLCLMLGYAVNLWVGARLAFASAIGRPVVEFRTGLVAVVVNVIATIPAAAVLGVTGVVAATAVAHVVATLYAHVAAKRLVLPEGPTYIPRKRV